MSVHLYQSPTCRASFVGPLSNPPFVCHRQNITVNVPVIAPPICLFSQVEEQSNVPSCDKDETTDNGNSSINDTALLDVVMFPQAYTSSQQHEAHLLKLIHSIGAPNGAFQAIMSWAQTAASANYNFQPSPLAYSRQIYRLENLVGMQACRPSHVSVDMYRPDMESDLLDVVVFDFPSMLASLFNCPVLNKLENLVVNPNDRFGKYEAPNGVLGEINSGTWYDTAYHNLVKDPDKDFLCPIIFAMDKTVISEMAGLHVFVILFTSSVFNREVSYSIVHLTNLNKCYLTT